MGPSLEEFVVDDDKTMRGRLTYPAASLDKAKATLTVRKHYEDAPQTVAADKWQYTDDKGNAIQLLPAGTAFQKGTLYEFTYQAKDPVVGGLGSLLGAALGALLRWQLGSRLNTLFPGIPPGTLAANLIGGYIVGLSYLARRESAPGLIRYWPLVLLAAPLVLAFIVNDGFFREKALLASAIVGLWALRCLRATLWQSPPAIGKTVSGLLAGICLVDLLAVADQPPHVSVWFLGCFVLALLCQRFVPAT